VDDSKQLGVSLQLLDDDMLQTDYMDDLVDVFMDQWNMFRLKRRSGHARPE
jgi:hypothetical protein